MKAKRIILIMALALSAVTAGCRLDIHVHDPANDAVPAEAGNMKEGN